MTEIVWTGADASTWDLRRGPVRLTTAGIKGLGLPEFTDQARSTALQDGQTLLGWKVKPREVWLPLRFKDDAARDVTGLQREFWRSVPIGSSGTLTVTDDDGGVRALQLRVQDDGGLAYGLDPNVLSDAFGLAMIADQPWWEGPEQDAFYTQGGGLQTFFGNGAGATPFYIIPATTGAARVIDNPGDAPAWIKWQLDGPATAFRAGVGGHYLGGPIVVALGQSLTVETDPRRQVAMLDGEKVTRQLTEVDWIPLPEHSSTSLDLTITGTGLLTATITPRYARAF